MGSSPLACPSFLHRTSTSGETTQRYSFHEVEIIESFAKIIICENNYSLKLFLQNASL